MMEEIKRGCKLIRYGYGLGLNCLLTVFLLVLGILNVCLGSYDGGAEAIGICNICMAPMLLLNLQQSLIVSGMAAASARRKVLEIFLPDLFTVLSGVFGYVVVLVAGYCRGAESAWAKISSAEIMIIYSVIAAIILIYFAACYKYYWSSVIVFVLAIVIVEFIAGIVVSMTQSSISKMTAAVLSLGIIVLGGILSGLLRRAFYRKKISPLAVGASLMKAMQ